MSINARVCGVSTNHNDTTRLTLESWDGDPPGQEVLYIDNPPEDDPGRRLSVLIGLQVWGDASHVMIGVQDVLADRISYTTIRLRDDWEEKANRECSRVANK